MDKIICIGKNYLDHAKELGDAVPERPIIFMKPPSVAKFAKNSGETLTAILPQGRGEVHFECEIVGQINAAGELTHVTLGLDMTLREVQTAVKKAGHPWEAAKVFRDSALVGPWIELREFKNYLDEKFEFFLNGELRQTGLGRQMRNLPEICLKTAKEYFPLQNQDILFTGTPAGVGAVACGDQGELRWRGNTLFRVNWE